MSDGVEKIDGLTREQVSVRVASQQRKQAKRQHKLRLNHRDGLHAQHVSKCDLCQLAAARRG